MMYGNAIVMGVAPAVVDAMSLAQWIAAIDGWNRAHGSGRDTPPAPSDDEYYSAMRMGQR